MTGSERRDLVKRGDRTATPRGGRWRTDRRLRRLIPALVLLALVLPASAPAAGASTIRVTAELGNNCLSGHGPANTQLEVTLRQADGVTLNLLQATTDGQGAWSGCFPNAPYTPITPGRRIRVDADGTVRTIRVPLVTAAGDRVRDRATGRAPTTGKLRVTVSDCRFGVDCSDVATKTVARAANGRWLLRHGTIFDARGFDRLAAAWTAPAGDRFIAEAIYPGLYVYPELLRVGGLARTEGEEVSVLVRPGEDDPPSEIHTATAGAFGIFVADFLAVDSFTLSIVEASIAKDARLTVPIIQRGWNAGTRQVSGRCLPFLPILLTWGDGDEGVSGTTGANGWYQVTLRPAVTGPADAEAIVIACESARGDLVLSDLTP